MTTRRASQPELLRQRMATIASWVRRQVDDGLRSRLRGAGLGRGRRGRPVGGGLGGDDGFGRILQGLRFLPRDVDDESIWVRKPKDVVVADALEVENDANGIWLVLADTNLFQETAVDGETASTRALW